MADTAQIDPVALPAAKPELDALLGQVSRHLEAYFAAPETSREALQSALAALHRACEMLRVLSLDGVMVFCGEIELLLQEIFTGILLSSAVYRDPLQRALSALTYYLGLLADGADDPVLRLFPHYQELQQARGMEMAFEVDLFFPELQVELPASVLAQPVEDVPQARIREERSKYQSAMLKWLRQDSPDEALQLMRNAVQAIMAGVAPERRAFWWVASALLDCMIYHGMLPEQNARKMLGRIDLQMKLLADGQYAETDDSMREMLYVVANSDTTSRAVVGVKRVYALEKYLPQAAALPASKTNHVLGAMRAQLEATKEEWEWCLLKESVTPEFTGQVEQLALLAGQLDRNTLQYLCRQVHSAAARAQDAEQIQRIALDMAMALLLLDGGMQHYRHLDARFHEQACILGQRLDAGIAGTVQDEGGLADLVMQHCRGEEHGIRKVLLGEIQDNLQHVAQSLDNFFADESTPPPFRQMAGLLHQAHGGLRFLDVDRAGQLLYALWQILESCAAADGGKANDLRTVATALGALQTCVQGLLNEQDADVALLDSVLQSVQVLQQSVVVRIPDKQGAAMQTVAAHKQWEGDELLEVFLEEAQEVLGSMRTNLDAIHLHPESREPLAIIRRGFHTLKGSGRMVGLTDLAEVAWAVERAMNKWLQGNKPATPGLLKFILDSETAFEGWVDALDAHGSAQVEASELVNAARQIEANMEAAPATQPEEPAAPVMASEVASPELSDISAVAPAEEPAAIVAPKAEPVAPVAAFEVAPPVLPDASVAAPAEGPAAIITPNGHGKCAAHDNAMVLAGILPLGNNSQTLDARFPPSSSPPEGERDKVSLREFHVKAEPEPPTSAAVAPVALSPSQMGIAMEEMAQHAAALLWRLTDLRESGQPTVSGDFLHEAHALAVVSRTAGFARVGELAHALELWLEGHIGIPFSMSKTQLSLLESTVAALDDMSLAVRNCREIQARPELVEQLHADREGGARLAEASQVDPWIAATETPVQQEHAGAVRCARPAEEGRAVRDDVDEHLLPIFLEEANDLFPQVGGDMRAWFEQPDEKALGRSLQRSLHTLKGSARMAGAMHLGELTHSMEERVVQAMAQGKYDADALDEVEDYFDRIGNTLEQLRGGQPVVSLPATGTAAAHGAIQRSSHVAEAGAEHALPAAMMRVHSGMVDTLVNESGEISVTRSRVETELRGIKTEMLELTDSMNRLREQLREIEIQAEAQMQARVSLSGDAAEKFDPLEFDRFTRLQELTRFMNESAHDVLTVQQTLLRNLDEAFAALSAQKHINHDLQKNLMAIRMVPFDNIGERLHRTVRQTCKELNKKANLELRGATVELDRSVLDRMTAPLEHMLRNAVAHGVESPQLREHAGKPQAGIIRLSVRQDNNEVIFELSDDGAGINLGRLRQKAIESGLLRIGENISDEQVMQLIFTSGLTTAAVVTEVSGRGVGMDVVHSEVIALGGRIEVSSKRGKGTHFIIHLPLTMVAAQALLVRAEQAVYAIPSSMVEQVQQIKFGALKDIYRQGQVDWKGNSYTLHYLPRLLGNEECIPESHPYNRVLLLRSGKQKLAVHVDELIGSQEIVVKNLGPQLAHLPGIAGATVLGNGSVVLILNPALLAQRVSEVRRVAVAGPVHPAHSKPVVMVVDDSLTVRKITSRLLERAGYEAVTAKDGMDALEQLGEISPAVLLLDIEMPRMDGFELTRRLRGDPKTRHLPIIIITSRTAEKHREYAQELGVNAYLGKPYQEEELLHLVAGFAAVS